MSNENKSLTSEELLAEVKRLIKENGPYEDAKSPEKLKQWFKNADDMLGLIATQFGIPADMVAQLRQPYG